MGKYVIVLCFAALLLTGFQAEAESRGFVRVLLLHSYHQGYEWTDTLTLGIRDYFKSRGMDVDLSVEYMDCKRLSDPLLYDHLARLYRHKFRDTRFTLIIAADNNALDFLANNIGVFGADTPVVFCGVSEINPARLPALREYTGVIEKYNFLDTFKLMLRLHPRMRKIFVINDRTTTGMAREEEIRAAAAALPEEVKVEFLSDMTMGELAAKLKSLPLDSGVFLHIFNRDKTGRLISVDEVATVVTQSSLAPVYGVLHYYLGRGIVGGYLNYGFNHGREVARLAAGIINGKRASAIPVEENPPCPAMFDHKQLVRMGVDMALLPEGSVVVNRPVSFYEISKELFWISTLFLLILLVLIVMLLINSGKLRRLSVSLKNEVEERAHAAQSLANNQENLRITLDSIGDAVIATDENGLISRMNPVAENLTGWTAREAFGKPLDCIFRIVDSASGREMENPVEKVLRSGQIMEISGDVALINRNGEMRHISDSGAPIKSCDGRIVGVVLVFRDVSEEYHVQQSLRYNEQKFREIFNSTSDGMMIHDGSSGIIIDANTAAEKMFGMTVEEFRRCGISDISSNEHPYTQEMADYWLNRTRREGQQLFEWHSRRKNGEMFWSEVALHCCRISGDECIIAVVRDVTERKAALLELQRKEEQLQHSRKMDAIGQLAGGVAHDFNNVLGGIMGAAELLRKHCSGDSKAEKYVGMIVGMVRRVADLNGKLLTFSRKRRMENVPFNLHQIVDETGIILESSIDKNIRLEIECRATEHTVKGDRSQFQNALLNIGINARDSMPGGGVLRIITSNVTTDEEMCADFNMAVRPGEYILLEVTDTGVGMDQTVQSRMFEPFFTTKKPGTGTGLGLSAVYGIVNAMRGGIKVLSSPGEGTVFRIYLPVVGEAATEDGKRIAQRAAGGTVLVIDDEDVVRSTTVFLLEDLGYEAISAENGSRGIELYLQRREDIRIVILDMIMPNMGGIECLAKLRGINPDLKVIVASGFTGDGGMAAVKNDPNCAFICKPYSIDELNAMIIKMIGPRD